MITQGFWKHKFKNKDIQKQSTLAESSHILTTGLNHIVIHYKNYNTEKSGRLPGMETHKDFAQNELEMPEHECLKNRFTCSKVCIVAR